MIVVVRLMIRVVESVAMIALTRIIRNTLLKCDVLVLMICIGNLVTVLDVARCLHRFKARMPVNRQSDAQIALTTHRSRFFLVIDAVAVCTNVLNIVIFVNR